MRRFSRTNGPTKKSSWVSLHYSGSRYVYDISSTSMFSFSHAVFNSSVTFIQSSTPMRSILIFWRRAFYELLGWILRGRSVIYSIRLLPHEPDSHLATVDCLTKGKSIPFSSVPPHHGSVWLFVWVFCVSPSMGMLLHRRWCFFVFSMVSSKEYLLAGQVGLHLNWVLRYIVLALLYTFFFGCPFPNISLLIRIFIGRLGFSVLFLAYFLFPSFLFFFSLPAFLLSRFGYF